MSKRDVMMGLQFLTDSELRDVMLRCEDILKKRYLLSSVREQVEVIETSAPTQTCSDDD